MVIFVSCFTDYSNHFPMLNHPKHQTRLSKRLLPNQMWCATLPADHREFPLLQMSGATSYPSPPHSQSPAASGRFSRWTPWPLNPEHAIWLRWGGFSLIHTANILNSLTYEYCEHSRNRACWQQYRGRNNYVGNMNGLTCNFINVSNMTEMMNSV